MKDLRSSLHAMSERGIPVGSDRLRERVALDLSGAGLRPEASRRVAPGWLLAAAFAVTALLIGIPALLLRGHGGGLTDQSSTSAAPTTIPGPTTTIAAPTTTVGATTTTTATPFPEALRMIWARVPDQEAFHGGWMAAATLGGPGLVAVGGSTFSDFVSPDSVPPDAGVWVSADGTTWERITSDSFRGEPNQFGVEGEQYMTDVVSWPEGLVAVGTDGQLGGEPRAVVWLSPDGRTWSRAPEDEVFAGGIMQAVTVGGPGLIAVGSAGDRSAIWSSADGVTWQRVFEGDRYEEVAEVTAWDGRYFAVGTQGHWWYDSRLYDPPFRALVWVSEDGLSWERLPDSTREDQPGVSLGRWPDVQSRLWMLLAGESGLLALGETFSPVGSQPYDLQTWQSTDGQTWQMGTGQFLGYPYLGGDFTDLIAADGRLLASHGSGEIWGSADGAAFWHLVATFEPDDAAPAGGEEIIYTLATAVNERINGLLYLEGTVFAFGKYGVWSRTEDIGGGRCVHDLGDGSLGQCRTDAAVWIGTFDQG